MCMNFLARAANGLTWHGTSCEQIQNQVGAARRAKVSCEARAHHSTFKQILQLFCEVHWLPLCAVINAVFYKKSSSKPRTKSFLIFGHISVLRVS